MKKQDADIVIDYVGRRGDGVGAWQGKPVFVPRTLPGETVRVSLYEDRDKGVAGKLIAVSASAPDRVTPPCPHYESCGGCALQHWDIESYRVWKTARPREMLERAGLAPREWKPPVFIPHGTRRRATLAAFVQNRKIRLGYHRARSHDITDISSCLVLSPPLQALADSLRPFLARLITDSVPADVFIQDTGLARDVLITGAVGARKTPGLAERELMAEMAQACKVSRLSWRARDRDEAEIILQPAPVLKQCGDLRVELPPGAFMQPSAEGEAALVSAVTAATAQAEAKNIADLFAGCGTFAGPLLAQGLVHAVESEESCVAALKKAGRGVADFQFSRRNLYSDPLTAKELAAFDAVVMDPPRMGAKEQAAELAKSKVTRVISVSCNPSTFVRDAGMLAAGGYRLDSAQVIDQFVWSSHIEMVGVFIRE